MKSFIFVSLILLNGSIFAADRSRFESAFSKDQLDIISGANHVEGFQVIDDSKYSVSDKVPNEALPKPRRLSKEQQERLADLALNPASHDFNDKHEIYRCGMPTPAYLYRFIREKETVDLTIDMAHCQSWCIRKDENVRCSYFHSARRDIQMITSDVFNLGWNPPPTEPKGPVGYQSDDFDTKTSLDGFVH